MINDSRQRGESSAPNGIMRMLKPVAILATLGVALYSCMPRDEEVIDLPQAVCDISSDHQEVKVPTPIKDDAEGLGGSLPDSQDPSSSINNSAGTFSIIHEVEGGQTLTTIAACYFSQSNIGVDSIKISNENINPDVIKPGDKIVVNITSATSIELDKAMAIDDFAAKTGYKSDIIKQINRIPDGVEEVQGLVSLPFQQPITTDDSVELEIVHPGQTLSAIARGAGISLLKLLDLNIVYGPDNPDDVKPGHLVLVPTKPNGVLPNDDSKETPKSPQQSLRLFLDEYLEIATSISEKYNLPIDAILAQAVVESDYGTSQLAREANNLFGIKADNKWKGEIYKKYTREEVSKAELDKLKDKRNVIDIGNGRYSVEIIQDFRKYKSKDDSFADYAVRIIKSGYYDDAAKVGKNNPKKFIDLLVDGRRPRYSTDGGYAQKIKTMIDRITQAKKQADEGHTPDKSPDNPRGDWAETIKSAELSLDGFKEFVASIDSSYMKLSSEEKNFSSKNGVPSEPFEFFTWHFTDVYYNKDGSNPKQKSGKNDPAKTITSMNNSGVGIRWFIDRDGKTYMFTGPNQRVAHIPPHSSVATGVEIESIGQENITKRQYEAAMYVALYELAIQGKLTEGLDLNSVVRGHGEQRDKDRKRNPKLNVRTDFLSDPSVAMRKKMQAFLDKTDTGKIAKIANNS